MHFWKARPILICMTHTRYAMAFLPRTLLGALCLLPVLAAAQIAPLKYELTGDVGGAVYGTQSVIRSKDNESEPPPIPLLGWTGFRGAR